MRTIEHRDDLGTHPRRLGEHLHEFGSMKGRALRTLLNEVSPSLKIDELSSLDDLQASHRLGGVGSGGQSDLPEPQEEVDKGQRIDVSGDGESGAGTLGPSLKAHPWFLDVLERVEDFFFPSSAGCLRLVESVGSLLFFGDATMGNPLAGKPLGDRGVSFVSDPEDGLASALHRESLLGRGLPLTSGTNLEACSRRSLGDEPPLVLGEGLALDFKLGFLSPPLRNLSQGGDPHVGA